MYGADAAYAELFNRPDWTGKSTSCSQAVNDMLALVKGNYTCNHPGYFTTIADNEAKPVGALYFAGEHTNSFYEFQGFMTLGRSVYHVNIIERINTIEDRLPARVFISCGQSQGTDEVQVAKDIAAEFRKLGFGPYVAVEEQCLRGIKENIFHQLGTSEYFVFIDFKREYIPDKNACRGSLFSHQELALASYLGLQIIAFHEKGFIPEDGIMGVLQGNSYEFTDRHFLKDVVIKRATERGWVSERQNELLLNRKEDQFVDTHDANIGKYRVFHVKVENRHKTKPAIGCYTYLEQIINTLNSEIIFPETVEVKWTGYNFPMANIVPQSHRSFDALFVRFDEPNIARPLVLTNYAGYWPSLPGPGEYILKFLVLAENFPPARIRLKLRLGTNLDDAYLQVAV